MSPEKSRETARLFCEYAETVNPEEIKDLTYKTSYDYFLESFSDHLLDKKFKRGEHGWVFFCQGWSFFNTTNNPVKKRCDLKNVGYTILHVFESTEVRKLATYLSYAHIPLTLPKEYQIAQNGRVP